MNFTSNFFSLVVFIVGQRVHYDYGVVMAAGQLIGARFGARAVIQRAGVHPSGIPDGGLGPHA